MHYALRQSQEHHIIILSFAAGVFSRVTSNGSQTLSNNDLCKLLEDNSIASSSISRKAINNISLEELLYQGSKKQQGNICIVHKSALFFIDFSKQTASYNRAGQQLLAAEQPLRKADLNLSQQTRTPYELPHQCSLFDFVWQLYHLIDQHQLVPPLQNNSAIKLSSWPSFELVKHNLDDYRMASLLLKRALTADQIMELLQLNKEQVYPFFNSLLLTHNAMKESSHIIQFSKKTSINKIASLWHRLRTSIKAQAV